MTVRAATIADTQAILALGARMHAEAPQFHQHKFLPSRAAQTLHALMDQSQACVLVAELGGEAVGLFVGIAAPHFACDFLQASDVVLYVLPEHRGGRVGVALIQAYLAWARGIGAEPSIGLNTGIEPLRTAKMLQALGAQNTGTTWTWRQ